MNTRRNLLLLCAGAAAFAQTNAPLEDPAQVIYDAATKAEAAGRADRAKLLMLTVVATYRDHALAPRAKSEIGAIYFFLEAEEQARQGKARAAYISFRTLAEAYPESPLSSVAEARAKALGPPPPRQ